MSRRAVMRLALVAVLGVVLAGCAVIDARESTTARPDPAAVTWSSGAGTSDPVAFGTWRNRPVDVWTTWNDADTWSDMRQLWTVDQFEERAGAVGRMSFAQPLLDDSSTFAGCVAGDYDDHFRTIATQLARRGFGDAYVRLGWEANGKDYPWSVGTDYAGYTGCFTRAARLFKTASPRFAIEWTVAATQTDSRIDLTYPGDAAVDVVGADFYDGWPTASTPEEFDAKCAAREGASPVGLCAVADFARAHGKRLSVPEWGIRNEASVGSTDNPVFVQKMFEFFVANRDLMAYEAYFDLQGPRYELSRGANPRAAAAYRALWSR